MEVGASLGAAEFAEEDALVGDAAEVSWVTQVIDTSIGVSGDRTNCAEQP